MKTNIIVALDGLNKTEILRLVKELKTIPFGYKITDAVLRYGISIVSDMKQCGASKVMVDVNINTIPSNIFRMVKLLRSSGTDIITVYNLDLQLMSKMYKHIAMGCGVLTSFDIDKYDNIDDNVVGDIITNAISHACECNCGYFVCPVRDVKWTWPVRKDHLSKIKIISPGIRLTSGADDHLRVSTPYIAGRSGTDYLIIGRPLLQHIGNIAAMKDKMKLLHGDYLRGIAKHNWRK